MVAIDDEIVSGPIADSHPQMAKRKDEPQPANQKRSGCISKTKRKEHQLFPKNWLARYPWIQQGIRCVWVDGTRNFRLKTVTDHTTSKDHLHVAIAAYSSDQRSMKGAVDKEMEKKRDSISLNKTHSILLAEKIARLAQIKTLSYLSVMCGLKQ